MKRVKYKKVRNVQPNYFEYTGIHTSDPVAMQLFVYDDAGYEEYKKVSLPRVEKEIQDELQIEDVKWLNIHGLHDVEIKSGYGLTVGDEIKMLRVIKKLQSSYSQRELNLD